MVFRVTAIVDVALLSLADHLAVAEAAEKKPAVEKIVSDGHSPYSLGERDLIKNLWCNPRFIAIEANWLGDINIHPFIVGQD